MVEEGLVKTHNMDTYVWYIDTRCLLVIRKLGWIAQKTTQATPFAGLDSPGTAADHSQLGAPTGKLAEPR